MLLSLWTLRQLTLEELIAGARSDSMFQSRLRVMDIDENDLTQLFGMIDPGIFNKQKRFFFCSALFRFFAKILPSHGLQYLA